MSGQLIDCCAHYSAGYLLERSSSNTGIINCFREARSGINTTSPYSANKRWSSRKVAVCISGFPGMPLSAARSVPYRKAVPTTPLRSGAGSFPVLLSSSFHGPFLLSIPYQLFIAKIDMAPVRPGPRLRYPYKRRARTGIVDTGPQGNGPAGWCAGSYK